MKLLLLCFLLTLTSCVTIDDFKGKAELVLSRPTTDPITVPFDFVELTSEQINAIKTADEREQADPDDKVKVIKQALEKDSANEQIVKAKYDTLRVVRGQDESFSSRFSIAMSDGYPNNIYQLIFKSVSSQDTGFYTPTFMIPCHLVQEEPKKILECYEGDDKTAVNLLSVYTFCPDNCGECGYGKCEHCNSKYYTTAENTCQPCDESCKECNGPASSECISCGSRRFFTKIENENENENTGTCQPCDESCKECNGPSSSECVSCESNLFLIKNENENVGTCSTENPDADGAMKTFIFWLIPFVTLLFLIF